MAPNSQFLQMEDSKISKMFWDMGQIDLLSAWTIPGVKIEKVARK